MNKMLPLGLIAASFLSTSAMAEDTPKKTGIKIKSELGVLITTGNTESSSYLGKLVVNQQLTTWRNKYTLDFLQKKAEVTDDNGNKQDEETDNRWSITGKGNYKFTEKSSAFVRASYTDDKYGAFAKYATASTGYSFRALERENMTLDVEAGLGYVDAENQDNVSESGELYRGAGEFEWQINDMTQFSQTLSFERAPVLDNTQTISETGISASFNSAMQMKFGYRVISNSNVEPGFEKTDTETSVTLVVKF